MFAKKIKNKTNPSKILEYSVSTLDPVPRPCMGDTAIDQTHGTVCRYTSFLCLGLFT